MIVSVSIDAVDIARFKNWHNYNYKTLKKVFTSSELDYCLKLTIKSSERFAARFAVKEASYKAFNFLLYKYKISFLVWCKAIEIYKKDSGPEARIDWLSLGIEAQDFKFFVSITHSQNLAIAVFIVES